MANVTPIVLDYRANDNASATIKAIADATKKQTNFTDKLIDALKEEEILRKNGIKALNLHKAARAGATQEQLKEIAALHDAIEATKQHSQANGAVTQQMRQARGMAGQLGHQVQDVAVQLQMGTDAMIIFGQQGGQVLSVLGGWGAAAGAVISVGAAIGTYFKTANAAASSTKELAEAQEDLKNRLYETARAQGVLNAATQVAYIQDIANRLEKAKENLNGFANQASDASDEIKRVDNAAKGYGATVNQVFIPAQGAAALMGVGFAASKSEKDLKKLDDTIKLNNVTQVEQAKIVDDLQRKYDALITGDFSSFFSDTETGASTASDSLNGMVLALQEEQRQVAMSARELMEYNLMQQALKEGMGDNATAAVAEAMAIYDSTQATKAAQEAAEELRKAKEKEIESRQQALDKLRIEEATFGMAKAAVLAYKAGLDGVIDAQELEAIQLQMSIDAMENDVAARKKAAAEQKRQADAIEKAKQAEIDKRTKLVEKLQIEAETYGMSEAAVLAYKLGLDGVIDAQELEAIQLQLKVDGLNEEAEARKKAAKAAQEQARIQAAFDKTVDTGPTAMDIGTDFDKLQDSYKTELELFQEQQAKKLELVNQHEAEVADVLTNYGEIRKRIAQETSEYEQAAMMSATQAVMGAMQQQVGQLSGLFDQASGIGKAFYMLNQTMSAGMAIINGYAASTNILKNATAMGLDPGTAATMGQFAVGMGYAAAGAILGQGLASFEGGGFTGTGVRSGGMDGKGGRLAVVHPNEKITDLEKNKGGSAPINVSLNISAVDTKGFDKLLAEKQGMIVSMVNRAVNNAGRRSLA